MAMEHTEWEDFHGRFGPCWLVARSAGHAPVLLAIDRDGGIHDQPPAGRWSFTFACDGLASENHEPWEMWVVDGDGGEPIPLELEFPVPEASPLRLRLPALSATESVSFRTRETYHLGFSAKTSETMQSLWSLGGWPLYPGTVQCGQHLVIRSLMKQGSGNAPARLAFRLEEPETPGVQSISTTFMRKMMDDRRLAEAERREIASIESIADMVGFFQPRLARSKNRAEYMFWKSLQELKWLALNSTPIPPRVSALRVHLLADSGRYLYRLPNPSGSDDFLWQDQRGARFFSRDAGGREHLLLSPPEFDIMLLAGHGTPGLSRIESMPTQPSN
jgi:hypothetical protein